MGVLGDRVAETSASAGNGAAWNLAGAKQGYQSFGAGVGYGVTTYYAIVHRTSGQWEVGIGSVAAGAPDVLTRTTVLGGSSGAGVRVNFAAGTTDVFVSLPASKTPYVDPALGVSVLPGGALVGTLVTAKSEGGTFDGGLALANNQWTRASNAAGTALRRVWKVDGSNVLQIDGEASGVNFGGTVLVGGGSGATLVAGSLDVAGDIGVTNTRGIVIGTVRIVTLNTGASASSFQVTSPSSFSGASYTANVNSARGTGYNFFQGINTTALDIQIIGNGNVQNTNNSYGAISDERLKQDISKARSQLDDFRKLEFINYRLHSGLAMARSGRIVVQRLNEPSHEMLGLGAQRTQKVCPGLVVEDKNGVLSIQYSLLAMKNARATQEVIEILDALANRVSVLEKAFKLSA